MTSLSSGAKAQAEKILIRLYQKKFEVIIKRETSLRKKIKKEIIKDWGIIQLRNEYLKLRKQLLAIESKIYNKLGSWDRYSQYRKPNDIAKDLMQGSKLEAEIEKRLVKNGIKKELYNLKKQKDKLLEELWLSDQPDKITELLKQMEG